MASLSSDSYDFFQEDIHTSYFITNDGRRYSVVFEEQPFVDASEFPYADRTYEVFLTLENAPPAYTTDPKIGATLAAIIREFIEQDRLRIVFFTCDTADGRHYARFKRFNEWFQLNNNGHFLKLEDSVTYHAIRKLFLIALIIRNDHPYGGEILVAFTRLNTELRARK